MAEPITPESRFPDVTLYYKNDDGIQNVSTNDLFSGKKVVLFNVPGAFTPTCSERHLPGFIEHASEIKGLGVDLICCVSVNDAFVMSAWGKNANATDAIDYMLADGNGDLARAVGLEVDLSAYGLGKRCKRFSMLIDDNVVQRVNIDESGLSESSAETMLAQLRG